MKNAKVRESAPWFDPDDEVDDERSERRNERRRERERNQGLRKRRREHSKLDDTS